MPNSADIRGPRYAEHGQVNLSAHERFREILREDGAKRALGRVSELLDLDLEVVALLCFEHDHASCHRGLVAEALAEKVHALAID